MKRILDAMQARRRRQGRLRAAAAVLCGAVVLAVGLGLMHPAITMGQEPECGHTEHAHTPDCYERLTINGPLICGLAEHMHADLCYDATGELTCQLPEHTHAALCYGEAQTVSTLICQLPEHTHTDSCYPETPAYTLAPEPHCGLAEHTHDEACGENCTIPEHTHTEECFAVPTKEEEPTEEEKTVTEEKTPKEAENSEDEETTEEENLQEGLPPEEEDTPEGENVPGEESAPEEVKLPMEEEPPEDEAAPEESDAAPALEVLAARFALQEEDRERLAALLEQLGLTPEELLTLLEEVEGETPIADLDSLEAYLAAFRESQTLDGESTENPKATMPMQFFLTLKNFVPTEADTTVHNTIDFTQHFCMTGTIAPITGYTSMEDWPMNPPSEDAWKAVVRANYPTLTEEQISHLEVVWVGAAPKSSDESNNKAYTGCQGHVDGYLRWEDGYQGPELSTACGITLTAGMWWNGQVAGNATCVLLRKNADGAYVEYDRKTFSRDPHTGEYDHIWTGLPGSESDYAMKVDGLDKGLWTIKYWDGDGYAESDFSENLPFSTPSMFEGVGWGRYGYKMLAWAYRNGGSSGSLRLEKQTLLNGQSASDATPENTLFTITNADGTYQNTVKYRDFLRDEQGNRYLLLDHLQPGRYTIAESGADKPGYVLEVTENATAEVTADGTATAVITNTYTTGAVLPSTGGVGTSAVYILGWAMAALAGAGLLRRNRGQGTD